MANKVFLNLPVKNVIASRKFFQALGFTINEQFSDESGACVVISDEIYSMILSHDKYKSFTNKEIPDTTKTSEVIITLAVESKEEVDKLLEKVLEAGGKDSRKEDYGWMYGRAFEDLDGHIWEFFWMDPAHVKGSK